MQQCSSIGGSNHRHNLEELAQISDPLCFAICLLYCAQYKDSVKCKEMHAHRDQVNLSFSDPQVSAHDSALTDRLCSAAARLSASPTRCACTSTASLTRCCSCFCFSLQRSSYVSLSGTGHITEDRAELEKRWNPIMKAWFPESAHTRTQTAASMHANTCRWESTTRALGSHRLALCALLSAPLLRRGLDTKGISLLQVHVDKAEYCQLTMQAHQVASAHMQRTGYGHHCATVLTRPHCCVWCRRGCSLVDRGARDRLRQEPDHRQGARHGRPQEGRALSDSRLPDSMLPPVHA